MSMTDQGMGLALRALNNISGAELLDRLEFARHRSASSTAARVAPFASVVASGGPLPRRRSSASRSGSGAHRVVTSSI